jgi:hypothetical protein
MYHHNTLFTGPLLDSTIDIHRLGISDIRVRTSSIVILLHSSCKPVSAPRATLTPYTESSALVYSNNHL